MTEQDFELLSAYIDNALTPEERAALESRLLTDAALRAELEALQRTVTMIRALPELRAPRNYTLDPAVYARPPAAAPPNVIDFTQATGARSRTRGISRLLIAAASVMLAFVAVVALLTQQGTPAPASTQSSGVALAVTSTQAPTLAAMPTPTLEAQVETFAFKEPETLEAGAAAPTDLAPMMQRSAAIELPEGTAEQVLEGQDDAAADLMMLPPGAEEESAAGSMNDAAASSMLDESSEATAMQESAPAPVQPSDIGRGGLSMRQVVSYALVVVIVWRLIRLPY